MFYPHFVSSSIQGSPQCPSRLVKYILLSRIHNSVCIISFLRLYSLHIASVTTDPTWDNIGIAIWSNVEVNIAIICPSLTTLRPLLSHLFPHILSTAGSPVYDQFSTGNHGASRRTNRTNTLQRTDTVVARENSESWYDSRSEVDVFKEENIGLQGIEGKAVLAKSKSGEGTFEQAELGRLPA